MRRRGLPDFSATHVEALGAEASYGAGSRTRASREVLLRLVVEHASREALEIFARELARSAELRPGTTGIYNGRPKPTPVVRLFTFFIDKSGSAGPAVTIGSGRPSIAVPVAAAYLPPPSVTAVAETEQSRRADDRVPLAGSPMPAPGDKGNSSNVAIIAREPRFLPLLRREVTPERVVAQLGDLVRDRRERFEAPGLHALNFVVQNALGGGGMASLRIDPQGKAYGQMALEMTVATPRSWLTPS